MTVVDVRSNVWYKIKSDSDLKFRKDHEIVEEIIGASEDKTIYSIDRYQHATHAQTVNEMVPKLSIWTGVQNGVIQ